MADDQGIELAPQWEKSALADVQFKTNNVVGNFNYPTNVPAYKEIIKFLYNCPLKTAFTSTPYFQYHNFLREFWGTAQAHDPTPSTDENELRPLKEFLISFSVLNGKRKIVLDFKTFCSATGLDYNNGIYVAHPNPNNVKSGLEKIALDTKYLDKTPVTKNSFPVAWKILFTFVIQVLGGNHSSTEQINSVHMMMSYCLMTWVTVDIGEIIYGDLVTKLMNKTRLHYVSYPRFISCALQRLLGCDYTQDVHLCSLPAVMSPSNFSNDPSSVSNIELTAHMVSINNRRDSVYPPSLPKRSGKSQFMPKTKPKAQGPGASGTQASKPKRKPKSDTATHGQVPPPSGTTKGTGKSQSGSLVHTTAPKDLEGNIQPASRGSPSTFPVHVSGTSQPGS